jgi:hypothetical protein
MGVCTFDISAQAACEMPLEFMMGKISWNLQPSTSSPNSRGEHR